ncbi:hypothetical protein WMY93_033312 [Mugilogobius chulae]|uniref:Transposase Tc1-like domain-containing protein n=1 Tax=Mugilogobius chulae TaxID=88201 RepID=A0AAW0MNZ6_9GOBI
MTAKLDNFQVCRRTGKDLYSLDHGGPGSEPDALFQQQTPRAQLLDNGGSSPGHTEGHIFGTQLRNSSGTPGDTGAHHVREGTIRSRLRSLLRSNSIKLKRPRTRTRGSEPLHNKVTLEKVLGITAAGNRALSCDPRTGLLAISRVSAANTHADTANTR